MDRKENSIDDSTISPELLHPFVHRLELTSTYDKVKVAVMTVTVLPIRVMAICLCLVAAWILACVGLCGLSDEELRQKPMAGWRKELKAIILLTLRALYVFGGFHWVTVKGKQATSKEAPIIAVAPHSTYFDALPVIFLGAPSIVAKGETEHIPFWGKLINYTQPVYVWRKDPDSRQNTIKEIIRRARSSENWPQVLIFPEGTCTNRTCLITFKQGAFYPGVPVQPVCIRYPNHLDTVTWTWEGPDALKVLWLTLTQIHNYVEIEYLPVYTPNDQEKEDSKLFANNVRQCMADALGVPVTHYTYDDCRLMNLVKNMKHCKNLIECRKLRARLGLDIRNTEESLMTQYLEVARHRDGKINIEDFARYLHLPASEPALQDLFTLYDRDNSGKIDFREYLIGVSLISTLAPTEETLQLAFKLYDRDGNGNITLEDIPKALKHALNLNSDLATKLFKEVDTEGRGVITYAEFQSRAQKLPEYAKFFSAYQGHKSGRRRTSQIFLSNKKRHE